MRLYNEEQIGSILKRAAELSTSEESQSGTGLSLEELKQLGAEAGLDPALIAEAARELTLPASKDREKNFWGGPLSFSREVTFDRIISADDWEEFLPAIRDQFGDPGIVATRGSTFEWTHSGASNIKGHVSIRDVDGRSHMSIFWSEPSMAVPFYVPTLVLSLISLPIIFESLHMSAFAGILSFIATVLTLIFLARFGLSKLVNSRIDDIDELIVRLETIAESDSIGGRGTDAEMRAPSSATSSSTRSTSGAPEVDLPVDEDVRESGGERQRTRSRRR